MLGVRTLLLPLLWFSVERRKGLVLLACLHLNRVLGGTEPPAGTSKPPRPGLMELCNVKLRGSPGGN